MANWKTINAHEQQDEVGNIYQFHGGVKSKACQECKKDFVTKIKLDPVIQNVPMYECEECSFKNAGGDAALDHKIQTSHKLNKIKKEKVVSIRRQLIDTPNIIKTEDDVLILCSECILNVN